MKRWQASTIYFWETAPFFRLLLPLITAIICYDKGWLPSVNREALIIVLSGSLSLTIALNFLRSSSKVFRIIQITLIHISLFAGGWFICFIRDVKNSNAWFGEHLNIAEAFQARLVDQPAEKTNTWKLKVKVLNSYRDGASQKVNGEAFVYVYKDATPFNLQQGDIIILPNKWIQIKNAGNPDEFDYARFCSRNNISYQQFLSRKEIAVYKKTAQERSVIDKTHDGAMNALHRYIKDKATLGLMQAMLLGDEINFDPELRQTYVETGIIHVVAISGGHVIVFFQIISLLFFWLRNKRYELVKYLIAVPLVCFYVAVAGAPTSAVRAAIMFSFIALGLILQKDKQPLNQLFTTAFFMLLFQPMWLFSVGFQLSFTAVLSLILFYQSIYRLLPITNKIARKIWSAAAASLAAEIIIAPIVIFYFHLLPVGFLIANVIAYLFMSVALFAGLMLITVSGFTPVATVFAAALTSLVKAFHGIIEYFQKLNPASFKHLYLSFEELVLVYVVIAGLAIFYLNKQRKNLAVTLTATCLLLSLFIVRKWKDLHQHQFVAYNINKKNYAEIISGCRYFPVTNTGNINPDADFATKEKHIASGAWKEGGAVKNDVINIRDQKLLLLRQPVKPDAAQNLKVDYLFIDYPIRDLHVLELQQTFHFKKIIIGSNQKRSVANRLKDSCLKYNIAAHFTIFDGAFVLK